MKALKVSISHKLMILVSILLILSIASVVWFSTRLFVADNSVLIQQLNADTASSLTDQVREVLEGMTLQLKLLGVSLLEEGAPSKKDNVEGSSVTKSVLGKDSSLAAVVLLEQQGTTTKRFLRVFSDEISSEQINKWVEESPKEHVSLDRTWKGESQIVTLLAEDNSPHLVLSIPFVQKESGEFTHILVGIIKYSKFVKAFGDSDLSTSFLVDGEGIVLAHPQEEMVTGRQSMTFLPIVRDLLEGKHSNGQTRYEDPMSKIVMLGAFRNVGFAGLGVVTQVPAAKAFEVARRVEYRSLLISMLVLFASFILAYLFSRSLTNPLKVLVAATEEIAKGNFKVELKTKTRDEVGDLTFAFNHMAKGLEERDRIKATFSKFHNKEIVEKLLSGEVNLGGEKRTTTILFCDLRGFTAMSGEMEPGVVVENLNEYLSRMVTTISKYGGVVDKYVGDAIMAIWGVPVPVPDAAFKAVLACVGMRLELAKLNKERIARKCPPLWIGMGLNRGEVIAGNIGSHDRMEYTVIGDSVNVASRMEAATKKFGCDLLISESVYEEVKDRILFETTSPIQMRGKTSSVVLYKVLGLIGSNRKEIRIKTDYSDYSAPTEIKSAA